MKPILLCTLIFFSVAFLLFIFILLSRLIDGIGYAQKRWMDKKAQQMITSYLFQAEEWNKPRLRRFRLKYLSNSLFRAVFLKSLITLHKNIIGESSDRLGLLYRELQLKKFTVHKLQSSSWNLVAQGIGELADIGTKEDIRFIRPFVNHKNPLLRSEAQVALLKLESEMPFSFLNELLEALSEWQQMHLVHAAENTDLKKMPDFSRWLHNKEESIVIFCIRMISQFDQRQAAERLISLLKPPYPSMRLRCEIIVAIRQLELTEAVEKLRQLYEYETPDNQREIERTMEVIAGGGENVTTEGEAAIMQ